MAPRSFNPPRRDLANSDSPLPLSRSNFDQFSSSDWNQFFSGDNGSGEDQAMAALIDQIPFCSENISEILNPHSLSEDFLSLPSPGFPSAGDKQVLTDCISSLISSLSSDKTSARAFSDDEQKREKSLTMKEEQTHSRGKRGHSTNSHSLAERLRRERISERMRFLQHLVPGCSKITGKAVMLDEIINYVQSLQRQVEFLSMKLATVSPELNLDVQRLLSQDIFLLQAGRAFDPQIAPEAPSDAMATSFLPGGSWER